jgi:hypothetical protein
VEPAELGDSLLLRAHGFPSIAVLPIPP